MRSVSSEVFGMNRRTPLTAGPGADGAADPLASGGRIGKSVPEPSPPELNVAEPAANLKGHVGRTGHRIPRFRKNPRDCRPRQEP